MYEKLRLHPLCQWIIIHLRYVLGFAFIPSGLVKLVGERFTIISKDHPIGLFFDGLYQSGFYYNVIGGTQVFVAFLLMTQRFATLGALLYSCVIFNIWMITLSLSFKGTWVITSLMMFATIILLIFDWEKLKSIVSYNSLSQVKVYPEPSFLWQITGLIYFSSFVIIWFVGVDQREWIKFIMILVVLIFIITNYRTYVQYRKKRRNVK